MINQTKGLSEPVGYRWRIKAEFNGSWGPSAWIMTDCLPHDPETLEFEPLYASDQTTELVETLKDIQKEAQRARGEQGNRDALRFILNTCRIALAKKGSNHK